MEMKWSIWGLRGHSNHNPFKGMALKLLAGYLGINSDNIGTTSGPSKMDFTRFVEGLYKDSFRVMFSSTPSNEKENEMKTEA